MFPLFTTEVGFPLSNVNGISQSDKMHGPFSLTKSLLMRPHTVENGLRSAVLYIIDSVETYMFRRKIKKNP